MRYPLRLATLAVVAGIALTLVPFFLPISWQTTAEFFHWPMFLVDRPDTNWLPINAGNRVITKFLINVVGWALAFVVFWRAGGILVRKQ